MKEQITKTHNEYGDKLANYDISVLAFKAGMDIHQVECFVSDGHIITDEWSGLIPEGYEFLVHRPTLNSIINWMIEHGIYLSVNYDVDGINPGYYWQLYDLKEKKRINNIIRKEKDHDVSLESGLMYGLTNLF